jgi:two-component system, chemotaxis family, protein-glutamate methylesterase/glutaminase
MINVLIVDDSKVVQEYLEHILTSDPVIRIAGIASSGVDAITLAMEKKPDVITMDYHMPDMNGYEATRAIMETCPTPIVIVSGSMGTKEVTRSFSLIEAGALAVVLRPPGSKHPDFDCACKELIQTVKLMSEVKVIRRFHGQQKVRVRIPQAKLSLSDAEAEIRLIAIGASTGGPMAIQKILAGLPHNLPVPVIIVQHISPGFVKGFKEWLSNSSAIPLSIASDGERLEAGRGYIAPDGFHVGIRNEMTIFFSTLPPENGLRPSVDFLFRSVAREFGRNAVGVLLSGMGKDGAEELKNMKEKGAVTIIQDRETSVIFGMPGEALKIGAADQVLPIEKIAPFLAELFKRDRYEV